MGVQKYPFGINGLNLHVFLSSSQSRVHINFGARHFILNLYPMKNFSIRWTRVGFFYGRGPKLFLFYSQSIFLTCNAEPQTSSA